MISNKTIKWIIALVLISIFAILYRTYNPGENNYFPKCPFKELTGLKCPGCGSQRAIHHLLNLDLRDAIKENALLVVSIPYLIVGLAFELLKNPGENTLKWRRILYGKKAIIVVLIIIIAFWISRNFGNF